MTATTTIYDLAGEAYRSFETATRPDGETYTRLKDEHRDTWLQDLVYEAHGEFLPDDWRYDCIRAALGWIHDNEPADLDDGHEFADSYVDVYNAARFAWLASDLRRQSYCDDAAEEFGFTIGDGSGVTDLIALGQYAEASEVYAVVSRTLQERMEEIEDEEAGDE